MKDFEYMKRFRVIYLIFYFLILLPFIGFSQINLSSPYHTWTTLFEHLQTQKYYPELAASTIYPHGLSRKERAALAVKLKQIIDASGKVIHPDSLPRDPNYVNSVGLSRYTPLKNFPEIYLEKEGYQWTFSKQTVKEIERIYERMYPFQTYKLLDIVSYFNADNAQKFMDLHLWQMIGIFFLLLIGWIIHKIFKAALISFAFWLLRKIKYEELDQYRQTVNRVCRYFSLLIVLGGLITFFKLLQLPPHIWSYFKMTLDAAQATAIVFWAYRLVDLVGFHFESKSRRTGKILDTQFLPILRKIIKMVILGIGVMFVLTKLEFNPAGLLAGISIGGLAVALGAQDTLKNLFGSIMIFTDKPFHVGDWIIATGVDGTVEQVGFRSTRVRTFYDSVITIPNGKIADMTIDNMGLRQFRRFKTDIQIEYRTPIPLIEVFLEGLRRIAMSHPATRKDFCEVHLNEFKDSSLSVLFYVFFAVPTLSEELSARSEIMLQIMQLADKIGVKFAYPTQTLHIDSSRVAYSDTSRLDKESLMALLDTFIVAPAIENPTDINRTVRGEKEMEA